MRKIKVLTFVSLDGVMQAPGGTKEDTSGRFKFGGWTVPYFDEISGREMGKQMKTPFALLLGRKTFEIFAGYWPKHFKEWPGINEMTKYVVSKKIANHKWENSVFINPSTSLKTSKNVVEEIKKLKKQKGPDMQVYGSSVLIQTLLKNDLVDELWLKTFPVILGKGKRLFGKGSIPAAFKLLKSKITPSGVIFAYYKRAGEIKTGSF